MVNSKKVINGKKFIYKRADGSNWRGLLRLFFIFSFSLSILYLPLSVNAADVLRITMPDVVRVETDACALGEVADISGPQALTEQAGRLLLVIENGVITREQVIAALKVSGLENIRVEVQMPEIVRVERGASLPASAQTREEEPRDLAALIKSLAAWDGEVEVRHTGGVPDGRLVSPASIVPGTASATLRFRDAAGTERSLAVRLTWTQPALVLTRSLRRGDVINGADVMIRQIRVNRPGVFASSASEVVGRSITRNLSQGEPLPLNLVINTPIIERGKSVTILVRSGGFVVRARGEAMESGALGDTIRVRNVSSRTVVTAVVVTDDTVEVRMP